MNAAAVIVLRRKKLIRRFKELGATSPDRAIPFAEIGMRRSWIFDHMIDHGVFVAAGQDRFYLREQAAQVFMKKRRRRALIVTGVLLLLFLVVLLATKRW